MSNSCEICKGELTKTKNNLGNKCDDCGHIYSNYLSARLSEDFATRFRRDEHLDNLRLEAYQSDLEFCEGDFHEVQSILDVGCSDGVFTTIIGKKYPEKRIVGIDIDRRSVELAREKNKLLNCDFLVGSIENVDLFEYDCILFRGTFQYFANPAKVLLEKFKNLKLNAKIIIMSLPNSDSLGFELNEEEWRLGDLSEVANIYSLRSVQKLFHGLNFVQHRVELPYSETPYYTPLIQNEIGKYTISKSNAFYGNIINIIFVNKSFL
jgi:SAM-dependent methyltransferase